MFRRIVLVGLIALWVTGSITADDIFSAARRGDLFFVKHYLEKDPENIRALDEAGYTALHWAGIRGQWEVFEALVGEGADPNVKGADGGTPLHWACHHDRPDMIRLLLDAGADPNVPNRWGRAPLHVAARRRMRPGRRSVAGSWSRSAGGDEGRLERAARCLQGRPSGHGLPVA